MAGLRAGAGADRWRKRSLAFCRRRSRNLPIANSAKDMQNYSKEETGCMTRIREDVTACALLQKGCVTLPNFFNRCMADENPGLTSTSYPQCRMYLEQSMITALQRNCSTR